MKNIAIIQARTGATRLPNKVLLDLEGRTVLEHVIDRVKQSKLIDDVIVATTISKQDLSIVKICADNNVSVFCGSENDVLDRYYQAARLFSPDNVIRITADCPLHDSDVIDTVIENHLNHFADYTSNVLEETFPDGLDCEIMKFSVLKEAWKLATLASEREHVTQYIIKNDKYKKISVTDPNNHGDERWTLDTIEDYHFIKDIYRLLYKKNKFFRYNDIIQILEQNPELKKINGNSIRNEGLKKSIINDYLVDNLTE